MKKNIFMRIITIALVAMSIMAVAIPAMATTYTYNGCVSASTLNIRSTPSTSGSDNIIGQYSIGDDVVVHTCSNRSWFQVSYNNQVGYVSARYIGILSGYASATVANPNGNYVYLYSNPGNSSSGFMKLYNETSIAVLHETYGNYTRVSDGYHTGWILSNSIYYG